MGDFLEKKPGGFFNWLNELPSTGKFGKSSTQKCRLVQGNMLVPRKVITPINLNFHHHLVGSPKKNTMKSWLVNDWLDPYLVVY